MDKKNPIWGNAMKKRGRSLGQKNCVCSLQRQEAECDFPKHTPNSQSKPLTLTKVPATPLVHDIETTPTNFIQAHNTKSTLLSDKERKDMKYPSAFHSYM
ncbi:hypothetical protein TNCV_1079171 [Trichonephila clavipes]|nr:hypothetical protein TNCV_1079171 [Trichonephila clavipes]